MANCGRGLERDTDMWTLDEMWNLETVSSDFLGHISDTSDGEYCRQSLLTLPDCTQKDIDFCSQDVETESDFVDTPLTREDFDPTLAELNSVGLDNIEPLENCPFYSDNFAMKQGQKGLRHALSSSTTYHLDLTRTVIPFELYGEPEARLNQQSDFSRQSAYCRASMVDEQVSTSNENRYISVQPARVSTQRQQFEKDNSSGVGWHCQIIVNSPIKVQPRRSAGNVGPVLRLQKRTLSELMTELRSDSDVGNCQTAVQWDEDIGAALKERGAKRLKTERDVVQCQKIVTIQDNEQQLDSDQESIDSSLNSSSDEEESSSQHDVCTSPRKGSADLQKRYFWLYNVQAKGPKGQARGQLSAQELKHLLDSAQDDSVTHKGRRSSVADSVPNPRRLQKIGYQLQELSAVMNRQANGDEKPLSAREKNKYASRICRLKRKAQHEANKIKLQGLDRELKQLEKIHADINACLAQRLQNRQKPEDGQSLVSKLELLKKTYQTEMVAEHTDEYVLRILEKLAAEHNTRNMHK